MSLWDKVVEIVNVKMNTEAAEILGELKAACPKRTGRTAGTFRIMGKGGGGVGTTAGGLLTSVRVGSTDLIAKYADEGNGGSGGRIYPHGNALAFPGWGKWAGGGNGKGGKYVLPSVSAYDGAHFVRTVADRHR